MLLTNIEDLFSRLSTQPGPIVLYGAGFFARLALFALRVHGYEPFCICDSDNSKHGKRFCGFEVMSVENLAGVKETAHIFVTSIYVAPIEAILKASNFSNIYSCSNLFKSVDYVNADLDLGDVPETLEYGQSRDIVNIQRQIELYTKECLKRNISKHTGLDLKYVDIVVTEACSMKCIDCSNLMQYYEKGKHANVDSMLVDIEKISSSVDSIVETRVIGGEPFLHKQMHVAVRALLSYSNIHKVVIYTNGTIVPKGENLECLKDDRVFLDITNYGEHSKRLAPLKEVLEQNQINFIAKVPTWTDSGRILPHQNKSEDQLKWMFQNCCNNDVLSLLHGRLYRCPFSAHATNLNAIPLDQTDWVDISEFGKGVELRKEIDRLYNHKEYLTACSYCNGRDYTTPVIEAAIQTKKPLSLPEIVISK
ncbi:radical SAM protein [Gammaproteobacteria bacterium]|nr:radical SAM protein [Gammaproteobacteria bacterium]